MKVLVHYTTKKSVFRCFSKIGTYDFKITDRIQQVTEFCQKYSRTQESLFFLVCYSDMELGEKNYVACKILFSSGNSVYQYSQVSPDMTRIICKELGLGDLSTYDKDIFYKVYTIEERGSIFMNNSSEDELNKIKLKYYSWDELLKTNDILFKEISNILFSKECVLKVASTYKPSKTYSNQQLQKKYIDALTSIGFISKDEIDVEFTTLHGDIGEFIMHIMLGDFLKEQNITKYIYPKLVFKTSPKMPVYGNDGTIFVKDTNEIYYLEAKFYSDLNQAINKAVRSLEDHNEVTKESLSHKIELFRNIGTDELDEIIEIDESVSENLVIFVVCDSHIKYSEILLKVQQNKKLNELKKKYSIVLFVLPILSKKKFMKYFKRVSEEVGGDIYQE